jgi:hypothetical protein
MSVVIKPLNLFEMHDKHSYFTKQSSFGIGECVQKIIDSKPFGDHPFYIFAHARTADNGFQKKILWQPRLSKPSCETNSMLFKVRPGSDEVRIIWMIPEQHLWAEYEKGKVCESSIIAESIQMFKKNRSALEKPEPDDLTDDEMMAVYKEQLQQNSKSTDL